MKAIPAAGRRFLGRREQELAIVDADLHVVARTQRTQDDSDVAAQLVASQEVHESAISELHFAQLEDRCDLLGLFSERLAIRRQRTDREQEKCEAPNVR